MQCDSLDYDSLTFEEKEKYKANLQDAVDLEKEYDKFKDNKFMKRFFDAELIKEEIIRLVKTLVLTGVNKEDVMMELYYYSRILNNEDMVSKISKMAKTDLENTLKYEQTCEG